MTASLLGQCRVDLSAFLGLGLLGNGDNAIQLGDNFRVNFLFGHETRQDVIIGLPKQIGQLQLVEEQLKERIKKIVGGFDVR